MPELRGSRGAEKPAGEFREFVERLRRSPDETEYLEFKQNDHGRGGLAAIGHRVSAIANALAIARRNAGPIVWGIADGTHEITGTEFLPRRTKQGNEELENWLTRLLDPHVRLSFHEGEIDGKHVVVLELGPATDHPVAFEGTRYIRIGSQTRRLSDYPAKEQQLFAALEQRSSADWSAATVDGGIDLIDPIAIERARAEFAQKNPKLASDVGGWDGMKFLHKVKLASENRLTRAAIVLLGRAESENLLSPAIARISWVLRGGDGAMKDYQHFGPPFLLSANSVFGRIRNLTYRYLKADDLFPSEVSTYDPWVIREALNNAIAHQDYSHGGKINVVEGEAELTFSNPGSFIPETVERVINADIPPTYYRNRCLVDAMVNLNMIDSVGSGIRKMFETQRARRFPLPDYDLSDPRVVKVTITGKVLDENYTRILSDTGLSLDDVMLLDRVQKRHPLKASEYKSLRARRLIEGRRPNVFVSAPVARLTGTKATYIKNRGLSKDYYKKLVVEFLGQFGDSPKREIEDLLLSKLSDALSLAQKRNLLRNLLQEMAHKDKTIRAIGTRRWARWALTMRPREEGR